MRISPLTCWAVSKLGFHSKMIILPSSSGVLEVTVCTRCRNYLLESHGLRFVGKISKMPEEFPGISMLLEGVGYMVAAREVRGLCDRFVEEGLAEPAD